MKEQIIYRLWLPMASIHGADFNLCDKCSGKIEKELFNDGLVLPFRTSLDTSLFDIEKRVYLQFSCLFKSFKLCEDCSTKFMDFLKRQEYFHFRSQSIELWRNIIKEG